VFEIPEGGRVAKGKSIVNLISKDATENITAFLTVKDFSEKNYVLLVTEQGLVKKTSLAEFSNPRKNGIAAISLRKKDLLKDVKLTDGTSDIIIGTHEGIAIRFHEDEVREMGRTAAGVRAIRLEKGDHVVGAVALKRTTTTILIATENGYGKRSEVSEYRVSHRGGKGIYTVNATDKTGKMIAIKEVLETDDIVIVTLQGMVIRQDATEIRLSGRNTQGVRLIRLDEGDRIADIAVVTPEDDEQNGSPEKDEKPTSPDSNGKGGNMRQEKLFEEKKKPELKKNQPKAKHKGAKKKK
jgi:DNA gyrase subunit A